MENKFEFPINKIIGANSENEQKVKKDWFDDTNKFLKKDDTRCAGFEQPLTLEKKDEINRIENYVNEIANQHGATEKPSPKVVLLKSGGVFEVTNGEFKSGSCVQNRRRILVDDSISKIEFATSLAHEFFHLAGYTSLRFSKENDDADLYRMGISLFSKDQSVVYFHDIEEALMAEETKILFDKYLRTDPAYAEEMEKTDFIKGWLRKYYTACELPLEKQNEMIDSIYSFTDIDDLIEELNGDKGEDYKFGFLHGYTDSMIERGEIAFRERNEERKKFHSLVDEILKNSKGKYADRQEVIDVFMRAHFSGRLLPLARMLEKSIGKGSFRAVANDFAEYMNEEENVVNEADIELLEKRSREEDELNRRQQERIKKLKKLEDEGILYINER